jgi:hypothetical protein
VNGANGKDFREAQFGKLAGANVIAIIVSLIDSNEYFLAGASEALGDFPVQRDNALANVDNQNDYGGRGNCEFDLLESGLGDDIGGLFTSNQPNSPGIYQSERPPVPFDFSGDAVSRYTGLIMHDGDALAGNAIKQGGLSDVRTANNGDNTRHSYLALISATMIAAISN